MRRKRKNGKSGADKDRNLCHNENFTKLSHHHSWKLAIRTLTILSTLPLDVLDLPASFGPPPHIPVPFYERQVRGLLRVSQAQGSTSIPPERRKDIRGRPYSREKTGPIEGEQVMVPYLARGAKQLGQEEKAQGTWSLVHGDYKIDNLIFGRSKKDGKWRVVGVLDWELCTLGSPVSTRVLRR